MKLITKVDFLKETLESGENIQKIKALKLVDAETANELFDILVKLTNHYNAEIKVAALEALRFTNQICLSSIIKENIRDENKKVRLAASILFHLNDLAA